MANEKLLITTIREPYYKTQDGLWELADAVEATKDIELIELLNKARSAMFEFEEKLTKKFIWD